MLIKDTEIVIYVDLMNYDQTLCNKDPKYVYEQLLNMSEKCFLELKHYDGYTLLIPLSYALKRDNQDYLTLFFITNDITIKINTGLYNGEYFVYAVAD